MPDKRVPLLASELFAISQGTACEGPDECHWCGAKCERRWTHDDLPPMIGGRLRSHSLAKRPGNGYVCSGCWCWRRPRVTVPFLGGGYKDGQRADMWSWYVAGSRAMALRHENSFDRDALYDRLLDPPPRFFLALRDEGPNLLQYAVLNRLEAFTASTPITYTLDNKPLTYTIYELEHALQKGPEGTEPGVQTLIRVIGAPPKPTAMSFSEEEIKEQAVKRGRGRPSKPKTDLPLQAPQNPSLRPIEP